MSTDEQTQASDLPARAAAEVARLAARTLAPGLHIVATPIGNLGDVTLRALVTLATADVIYCEDTRHSRTLVAAFGIATPLRAYHDHNADQERPRVLAALAAGSRVALISDAGTPLISDPGYKLARDAAAAGHPVWTVPGACAAIAALTVAGLPTDAFLFAGFLPPRAGQRRTRLRELSGIAATLVLYEAPNRVRETLADMLEVLGDRPAVVARELTKLHEEVLRGSLSTLDGRSLDSLKGEVVILVGGKVDAAVTDDEISAMLKTELLAGSTRDAVRAVAERLGVARSRVYELAVSSSRDSSGGDASHDEKGGT